MPQQTARLRSEHPLPRERFRPATRSRPSAVTGVGVLSTQSRPEQRQVVRCCQTTPPIIRIFDVNLLTMQE